MECVDVVGNGHSFAAFQDMSNKCPSDGCQPLLAPAAFLCQIQGVKGVSQNNHFQQINQLIHVQLALWTPNRKDDLASLHQGANHATTVISQIFGVIHRNKFFLTLPCILYRHTVTVFLSVTIDPAPKTAKRSGLLSTSQLNKPKIYSLRWNDPEEPRKTLVLIIIPFSPSNITGTIFRATFSGFWGALTASSDTPQIRD